MSVFLLSKKDQLLKWKEFRDSIENLSEYDQLEQTMKYWEKAPIITYAIDWNSTFPTPWEVIHEGYYDSNMIAYMMAQTLEMIGWDKERIQMCYIKTKDNTFEGMILIIDNKFLINYSYNEILNIDDYKDNFRFLRINNNMI